MKRNRIYLLIVVWCLVSGVGAQTADHWLKQGNDFYDKQQFGKAVECYQKAAEAGSQEGQFNLGYALYNGEGIDKDYATAAMWFKRAARKGFAKAQYNLAYCYMYGRGVPIDYDKALRNLTDAANNGNQNAQLTLAECYEKGVLVMQDKKMSQLWKDKAAGKHSAAIPMQDVAEVKQPATAPKPATTQQPDPKQDNQGTEVEIDPKGEITLNMGGESESTTVPKPAASSRPVPPEVRILFPEDQSPFHTDVIKLRYQLLAQGLEASTRVTVMVDGQKQPADRAVRAANTVEVDLPNRDCTVTIYAQNENGNSEPASIRLVREKQIAELPRLFAVAIGVGDYNDPELPKLKFTTKDARDFAHVLSTKKGYPYQDVQVKTITDEEATREDFYEAMEWLKQESSPTDVCIFFYAGHGYRDEKDRFYFMNYGSSTSKLYNCFSSNDFRQAVEDINGKLIVFVDACYSGALMGGNRSAASNHFVEQLRRTKNGMVMYASSASDTKSKENEDWKNGAFTKALVDAFNGAARGEGEIGLSTQQLDQYLYKAVRQMTDFKQTPIFMNPNGMEPFELFTYEK